MVAIVTEAAMPSAEGRNCQRMREERKGKRTVREHIPQDCEFVMERGTTPDEPMDSAVDRTLGQPLGEGIEQQFRTPIRVLPPSVQFVVDRKRDTFLESALRICGPPNDVTLLLQSHGHVEILRDVVL